MEHQHHDTAPVTLGSALGRGLRGRCPNCGRGRLFLSYLKQADRCGACGEGFDHIHPDDAAPWFTMLIVGLSLIPVMIVAQGTLHAHFLWTILFLSVFILAVSLVSLPLVKGALLAAFWFYTSRSATGR
ncbi:MAG: DUF983 domain-containing protein [Alphaproteobacteria bacterium]|nr:DUF983 domain-containing protein [Alphaproteobacteria bacterium]